MKIRIDTIPHYKHRYPTVGDYYFDEKENMQVIVSDIGNTDYEFLVGIHELIEFYLTHRRNISEKSITLFDIDFEKNRGKNDTSEPGDDPRSPYHKEHCFATGIERLVAAELGINWKLYEDALDQLF